MRIAVLVIGILGACGAGLVAAIWLLFSAAADLTIHLLSGQSLNEILARGVDPESGVNLGELQQALDEYHWTKICIWFLLASFVLGLLGSILGSNQKRIGAAVLLLAAFAAPALIVPATAQYTFLLAVAGLLAFFIRKPELQPA